MASITELNQSFYEHCSLYQHLASAHCISVHLSLEGETTLRNLNAIVAVDGNINGSIQRLLLGRKVARLARDHVDEAKGNGLVECQ